MIDQRRLPHEWAVADLRSYRDGVAAIRDMAVRGAPLIGATAAWSLYLAARESQAPDFLARAGEELLASRPTAVNLRWAVERTRAAWARKSGDAAAAARAVAEAVCDEDVAMCQAIGRHGLPILEAICERRGGEAVRVLTHCNAGWLAAVDWGTATAPIYAAQAAAIPLHVWVDETRPRNQGASLTAWELGQQGVPHTVVADNAGGHLMQRGEVDVVIVGTDRTTCSGDVANKVGTYLKALAAKDNDVPFHVAAPSPSIDWRLDDGRAIPIEERSAREVTHIRGWAEDRALEVRLTPEGSAAANPAFDVTPARLVTGLITERGVCEAGGAGLAELFPEAAIQKSASQSKRRL